jgi:hypothetical protein
LRTSALQDPKLADTGDYNLFRYCHNDPIDFTDPMGLDDIYISAEMDRLGVQASLRKKRGQEEKGSELTIDTNRMSNLSIPPHQFKKAKRIAQRMNLADLIGVNSREERGQS